MGWGGGGRKRGLGEGDNNKLSSEERRERMGGREARGEGKGERMGGRKARGEGEGGQQTRQP